MVARKEQEVRVLNNAAKASYEALHRRVDQVCEAIVAQNHVQEERARVLNHVQEERARVLHTKLVEMEHRMHAVQHSMLDRMDRLLNLLQQQPVPTQIQGRHQQRQDQTNDNDNDVVNFNDEADVGFYWLFVSEST